VLREFGPTHLGDVQSLKDAEVVTTSVKVEKGADPGRMPTRMSFEIDDDPELVAAVKDLKKVLRAIAELIVLSGNVETIERSRRREAAELAEIRSRTVRDKRPVPNV
jgi:hypothetical protein